MLRTILIKAGKHAAHGIADGNNGNHRTNADNDAKHGQNGTHFIGTDGRKGHGHIFD